jgi:hypothetical protein
MAPSNRPTNKDFNLTNPDASITTSTGLGTAASKSTPSSSGLASQSGETRSDATSDIKELGGKFNIDQTKQEDKSAGKELATGAQAVVVDKAIEVKDAVIDKAVEVKDAIVDTATEAAEVAVEKLGEAKQAVTETLDNAGNIASRWDRASWRFTTANALPLALVGLGASWMIMSNRRSPTPKLRRLELQRRQPGLYVGGPDQDVDLWDPRGGDSDQGEHTGYGRGRAQNAKQRGQSLARRDTDALMQRGKRQAVKGARVARESLSRARDASLDFMDANPLAVAVGTLALGVGVGLLLPTTEREERLLAPTREKFERLMGDAREVATDVVEIAKETASETMARS